MKKFTQIGIALLCLCTLASSSFAVGESDINVQKNAELTIFFNGDPIQCLDSNGVAVLPVMYKNTTYVPLATVSHFIGKKLSFEPSERVITVSAEDTEKYKPQNIGKVPASLDVRTVQDDLNHSTYCMAKGLSDVVLAKSNEETVRLEDSTTGSFGAMLISNELYVPLRTIANTMDFVVEWNTLLYAVDVMEKPFYDTITSYTDSDLTKIPVEQEYIYSSMHYMYYNVFQDSTSANYNYSVTVDADGTMLFVNRESYNRLLEQEVANRQRIDDIVNSLQLNGKTDREKVMAISNWICDSYVYRSSPDGNDPRALADIISSPVQVCEGYARMFLVMCRSAGLNAQYLMGHVGASKESDTVLHAWNRVYIGDSWYYVDLTAADGNQNREDFILISESDMVRIHAEQSMYIHY